jgi:nicotinamidase-related amidase
MNHLLLIDPQNDFCDLPSSYCPSARAGKLAPALPVAGAHADLLRVAELIERAGSGLGRITVTLDSHQRFDIGHPSFWRTQQGAAPSAFTQVTAEDVRAGRYVPSRPELRERVLAYLEALERAGRYRHMIWPTHCELGSFGHNIHEDVRYACQRWEDATGGNVTKVLKGLNPYTEHYSAVRAEVPDPEDPATRDNQALLDSVRRSGAVYIAGEAGSHCVKATTEHIAAALTPSERQRVFLLTDCMSPVAGFEAQQQAFLAAMRELGLGLLTSTEAAVRLAVRGAQS